MNCRTAVLAVLTLPVMSMAADYTAEKTVVDGIDVIRLTDSAREIEVLVAPSIGNNSYSMTVKGKKVFYSPKPVGDLKARPSMVGNPFLAPWANRLDGEAWYANGKKYLLNPALGNYRKDGNGLPIHGLVMNASQWEVVAVRADANEAAVTSRLELWRYPDWMEQFPFAHTIEMTYRLAEGKLEVVTAIENHSVEPMPVSVAYHPYFQINDAPRDEWTVHLGAREHLILSDVLTPTGETEPIANAGPLSLSGTKLDDLFGDLVRDSDGRAVFSVEGASEKISVVFGPKYQIAVVYAPPGRDFICFEPMSGPTNAFNLAEAGKYDELQSIPAGGTWRESFWVEPTGY
jgi:aldose 1-epimerase